jgi:hypothetical protein
MRTTLDIADDVLFAARERAKRDSMTIGAVISQLARQALVGPATMKAKQRKAVYGLRPIASRGAIVTDDLIDKLREDDVY